MTNLKMHSNEVHTDAALVRRLLEVQFPHWAKLPLEPVKSAGTDNAIFRLGDDLSVRLPRIGWATGQIEKEFLWLPKFAPQLPLEISVPLEKGIPGEDYPYDWAIYRWLEGENLSLEQISDPNQAAKDLAQFLRALQAIDPTGGPTGGRGVPLSTRDEGTRESIAEMHSMIDMAAATRVWDAALKAEEWNREPVWFHGDLLPGNVLFNSGRVEAVIDFGGLAVGDPACDLMIAWSLFSGESRQVFRETLEVDDATWARGRGWMLSQAVIFVPYYLETNPLGVARAIHAIKEVLNGA